MYTSSLLLNRILRFLAGAAIILGFVVGAGLVVASSHAGAVTLSASNVPQSTLSGGVSGKLSWSLMLVGVAGVGGVFRTRRQLSLGERRLRRQRFTPV